MGSSLPISAVRAHDDTERVPRHAGVVHPPGQWGDSIVSGTHDGIEFLVRDAPDRRPLPCSVVPFLCAALAISAALS